MEIEKVFIDGEDRTDEIQSYYIERKVYMIKFKSGEKKYRYNSDRVIIEKKRVGVLPVFHKIAETIKTEGNFSSLGKSYEEIDVRNGSLLYKYLNGVNPSQRGSYSGDLIFPFRFNLSQFAATKSAFESQISIIQGPPGTGKTQTILNIVANIVMKGETVAVVSSNNAAVENVRDKLIKSGYGGIFALLGSKSKRKKFFDNQKDNNVYTHCDTRDDFEVESSKDELSDIGSRLKTLMEVERKINVLEEEEKLLRLERDYYLNAFKSGLSDSNLKIGFINMNPEQIIDFLTEHKVMMNEKERLTLLNKFKLFLKFGIYKFKRLNEKEYEIITKFQLEYYDLKIKDLKENISKYNKTIEQLDMERLSNRHYEISKEIFQKYLSKRFQKFKKHYKNETYKNQFEDFIHDYPVILSTAFSITNSIQNGYEFDYIIVDEASTLDLVKAMLPLSCAKNLIIVGDQKQLPHIAEKTEFKFDNQAYDYNTQNIMGSLEILYGKNIKKTLLKEHYRCHPDIIRFCNLKYYNGELITYSKSGGNSSPINLIITAPGNHMREITNGERGTINRRELEELSNLI